MSIKTQLEILSKRDKLKKEHRSYDSDLITDIKDGKIYQDFKNTFRTDQFEKVFSFLINTDGISICDKSKISIWPVYLVINELPKEERFHINNIIIAAICVGLSKPEVDIIWENLYSEFKSLEHGVVLKEEIYRFYCLFGVYDKPARALVLNMVQSNGKFGCLKCLQSGITVPYKKGHHHIYPFEPDLIDKPLRTPNNYNEDLTNKKNGVKGPCCLFYLRFYHPIFSTNIDVMHSILLGVVKQLFGYWFSKPSSENYSLINKTAELEERMSRIRPPQFIQQAPRRLLDYKLWRAHEFLNFLLYFSIPTFYEIMDQEYFDHFLLLMISLEILLAKSIKKNQLDSVQSALSFFVSKLKLLYDEHIQSSSMHELLHLVQCTKEIGPLNECACFVFEEHNRNVSLLLFNNYYI
jgi:hypothetical protein